TDVSHSHLLRFNADATPDSDFKPDDITGQDSSALPVSALAVDAAGRTLITGQFTSVGTNALHIVARLNADGTLDSTFDAAMDFSPGIFESSAVARSRVTGIGLQDDGGIVIGGNFAAIAGHARFGVARFQADVVTSQPGARPVLHSPIRAADGTFSMTVTGEAGRSYRVEASADLRTWSAVGTVNGATTPQLFKDSGTTNLAYRDRKSTRLNSSHL